VSGSTTSSVAYPDIRVGIADQVAELPRRAFLADCRTRALSRQCRQWYDFALYGAFATIIGPVFFPAEDPSVVMLAAFATYSTALIVRPIGALLFGRGRTFEDAVLSSCRSSSSWPELPRPLDSYPALRPSAFWHLSH
jgi:hypothetical protein